MGVPRLHTRIGVTRQAAPFTYTFFQKRKTRLLDRPFPEMRAKEKHQRFVPKLSQRLVFYRASAVHSGSADDRSCGRSDRS